MCIPIEDLLFTQNRSCSGKDVCGEEMELSTTYVKSHLLSIPYISRVQHILRPTSCSPNHLIQATTSDLRAAGLVADDYMEVINVEVAWLQISRNPESTNL